MGQTLRDIAAAANVSISTASRALNGHTAISAETIGRVRAAAEQLRYRPRRAHGRFDARRCLSSATVGVLALGMDPSLLSVPAVASAINGAEEALSDAGAQVRLAHIPDLAQPPGSLLRERFDGLILCGALQGNLLQGAHPKFIEHLSGLPTVWLLGRPDGCWGDAVVANDYQVGAEAAEHLVASGHRQLAFVNPKPDHLLFVRRQDGFAAAAQRLGAEVQWCCQPPSTGWKLPLAAPQGVELVQSLVDDVLQATPRPTAIFAAADSVAALVYRALAVRGLKVGEEVSVISGNNDESLIAGLHPHLTTFEIHARDFGRLAVRQLAAHISYPADLPECETMLPPTLIEGASVANLAANEAGSRKSSRTRRSGSS